MEFKKDDENYIYGIISKNIKKYRKLKGWTQEQLADNINYSLSFIRGIESNYPQTFSLGAIWRIACVLEIDFYKLCIEDGETMKAKSINFKCNKCGIETKIPTQVVNHFKNIYELTENKSIPHFDCINDMCDGQLYPVDPMEI